MNLPNMIKVKQLFDRNSIENPSGELALRLRKSEHIRKIRPGMRIAITAGSRGIHGIAGLIRTVTDVLKEAGAEPFIVPAMGSHGGATPEGQREMLEGFGITEEAVGAPIMSSMETEITGTTKNGEPVFMDKNAFDADGIVVINRIKRHTAYHGKVESGLCKMVAVGLGKREGAESMHRQGLGDIIVESFRVSRDTGKLVCGIGILENAFEETCELRIASPDDFETVDNELLERCKTIMPGIPFGEFDILIVDEIGKNISGTGMDTNVIGFWRRIGGERKPDYKTLIVLDLTDESHGNALGVGFADLITRKLFNKIDFSATYTNGITTGNWSTVRLPITLETDDQCLSTALSKHDEGTARIVRIKNTLDLEEIYISEPLREDAEKNENLLIIDGEG
jgi:hypothetical protein